MTKSLSNLITLILAGVGTILALVLTIEHYFAGQITLPCTVGGGGCHATLSSDYAHLGPIPTAAFGMGMYLVFVGLCWQRRQLLLKDRADEEARARAYAASDAVLPDDAEAAPAASLAPTPVKIQIKQLDMAVWLLALSGFCISWWLQYTSIFVITSFCPYCFTSALLVTAIFALASSDYLLDGRKLTGEQKLLGGVLGFILVMLAFVYGPTIWQIVNSGPKGPVAQPPSFREFVNKGGHTLGDPNGKAIVVEFADYMCPHCAEAAKEMPRIMKEHPEFQLRYRNFPLGWPKTKFPFSAQASLAAEAAGNQGKFWEMHDLLFSRQKETSAPDFQPQAFSQYARELGLDVKKFEADMQSQDTYNKVQADSAAGMQAEVNSTPTLFFLSKSKITSFTGITELEKILKNPKDPAWK